MTSLCYSMCTSVTNMVEKDKSYFPPNSVKDMVCTIQMSLNTNKM